MAATDLLTLAEVHGFLGGIEGSAQDERLALLISAVSERIDALCGPVVSRTVEETFTARGVKLRLKPRATAIVSVTEADFTGSPVELDPTDFFLLDGEVYRGAGYSTYLWSPYPGGVTVTYTAGICDSTADVPAVIKHAAGIFCQHLWRSQEGGGSETYGAGLISPSAGIPSFGVPNVVADLLAGYRLDGWVQ